MISMMDVDITGGGEVIEIHKKKISINESRQIQEALGHLENIEDSNEALKEHYRLGRYRIVDRVVLWFQFTAAFLLGIITTIILAIFNK